MMACFPYLEWPVNYLHGPRQPAIDALLRPQPRNRDWKTLNAMINARSAYDAAAPYNPGDRVDITTTNSSSGDFIVKRCIRRAGRWHVEFHNGYSMEVDR